MMIGIIKESVWKMFKNRKVSLVMFYDDTGEILWHRGRKIHGKNVISGKGFCCNLILETIKTRKELLKKNLVLNLTDQGISQSPDFIKITHLMIIPIPDRFHLYVDSTSDGYFKDEDRFLFENLGALLGDIKSSCGCFTGPDASRAVFSKSIPLIGSPRRKPAAGNKSDITGISGESPEIKNIRKLAWKYSIEEEPVLLIGETGAGKNHIAELIHRYSGRKGQFVIVHTPSIPETLFESEIFGHLKGAFTGAHMKRDGLIALAEGGTILFDEIAEVPISFQAKLLYFIDTKKYRMLGDSIENKANVRIVSSTNRNLIEETQAKRFREDLYFRLSVLQVEIPPLRNRKEDIKSIVMEYQGHLRGKKLSGGFWEVVFNHDWPGNVRELIHVIKRAGIQLEGPIIGSEIEDIIQTRPGCNCFKSIDHLDRIWDKLKSGGCFWDVVKKPFLDRELNRAEVKSIISKGLKESGGEYKKLLKIFNIDPTRYINFMRFLYDNRLR